MKELTQKEMNVPFGSRMLTFLCAWVLMAVLASGLMYVVTVHGVSTAKMRIVTLVQDILLFISPAIITAIIATRLPARLLLLNRPGKPMSYLLLVGVLLFSIPVMNWLVHFNQSLDLPAWMGSAESDASAATAMLLGGATVADLIINILIVGFAAAFSEELFFRGGLQQLLITRPMNPHAAIWLTAFIFSAMHMQFYGFLPRLLLGAYFGYLAWWSDTIWLPVTAHFLNNTAVVVSTWLLQRGAIATSIDDMGSDSLPAILISLALTAFMLVFVKHSLGKRYDAQRACKQIA